jgi:hypothetical protein
VQLIESYDDEHMGDMEMMDSEDDEEECGVEPSSEHITDMADEYLQEKVSKQYVVIVYFNSFIHHF